MPGWPLLISNEVNTRRKIRSEDIYAVGLILHSDYKKVIPHTCDWYLQSSHNPCHHCANTLTQKRPVYER